MAMRRSATAFVEEDESKAALRQLELELEQRDAKASRKAAEEEALKQRVRELEISLLLAHQKKKCAQERALQFIAATKKSAHSHSAMLDLALSRSEDEKLGLDLEDRIHGLQVISIGEGVVARYNLVQQNRAAERKKARPTLCANDYIVSINGVKDRQKMIKSLKASATLCLKVSRPDVVSVVLTRGELDWGIDVYRSVRSTSVEIRAVSPDGAVQRHNDSAPEHQRVCEADCILSCNGVSGAAERIWLTFRTAKRVEVDVLRVFPLA